MLRDFVWPTYFFVLGATLGSFVNVLIYRLPREISLVKKRSYCPHCEKKIPWYQNIPVFTFIFQKARCNSCRSRIPTQYFLIELGFGVLSLLIYPDTYSTENIWLYAFEMSLLIVFVSHFFIDLKFYILPDVLNFFLLIILCLYSYFYLDFKTSILGFMVGFFGPLVVSLTFFYLRKVEGLGMGDVKLYGVLGILLGPIGIMQTIFLSCFFGSLFMLVLMGLKRIDKNTPIPFGPFILLVSAIQYFFPNFAKNYLVFF